ncbi:hypothetical protein [Thermocoleostomius sinensis]|uniref:Uncharacterized protein n=1 Tax=Thermocoleostomius sinensis A174 TaxID=2016057 RepID=A0A9E8ZL33_9CYAN|nr:hypothetical protein [Thermocoleostomius sinensis]WAL60476.1 hypothetical protein OXH18_00340 [Thermocoleostomius sinensis A174]
MVTDVIGVIALAWLNRAMNLTAPLPLVLFQQMGELAIRLSAPGRRGGDEGKYLREFGNAISP